MTVATFTVLGAQGFIGRALTQWLRDRKHIVYTPARQLSPADLARGLQGHVLYCIGLTADFRNRPWDTVDAHVGVLRELLAHGNYASMTYLSSTRVYLGCDTGNENAALTVKPEAPDQLYNLSKLLGESLCNIAYHPEKPVRVVRLSNVVGDDLCSDNFIYSLLLEAQATGTINLDISLDSSKDYIPLSDVTRMLELIAVKGQERCYNLASGRQTTTGEIVEVITKITGAKVRITDNPPRISFPAIDIFRIKTEFNFLPSSPLDAITEIINRAVASNFKNRIKEKGFYEPR